MDKRDLLTEAGTPLPTFDKDMGIIEKLDDEPNDVGGLTSFELKQKFDEGGKAVKTYLNETLLPAIQGGGGGGGGLIGEKIEEHNVALDAHADIRQKITGDIGTHNAAPDAHQDIRQEIADNKADTDAAAQRADDHIADQNNPHQVTYEQVGADPAGAASAALTTALATAKGAVAAADCYDEAASATSNPNTWYVSKDTPRPSGEAGMTIDVRWQHGHAGGLGYNVTLIWGAPDAPDNETILSGISVTDGLTGEASIPTEGTIRYQLINQSGRLTWKYVSGPVLTRQFSSATSAAVADKLVPGLSLSYLPGMEIVVQLDDGNTADTMRLVPDEGPTLPVYGNAMETKTGVIPRGYICRLRNAEDHWQLMEQTQVIKAPTTPGTAGQILTQTETGEPEWGDGKTFVITISHRPEFGSLPEAYFCDYTGAQVLDAVKAGKTIGVKKRGKGVVENNVAPAKIYASDSALTPTVQIMPLVIGRNVVGESYVFKSAESTELDKAPANAFTAYGLPAGGTDGQVLTQTASGTPQWRDGGGLDKAAEHWATVKVAETISSITDEATFRTHFYDLRKSQDRKYQFEITQGGVHENIVTGVGGRPSGADPRDRAFLYVDIPYSEAGGYIIHVTYELRDKTGLWEKSIYATLNSGWRDTGWIAAEDRTPLVVTVDKEGGGGYKADYNSSAILAAAQAHRAVIMRYTDTDSGLQTDVLLKGQDGGLPLFYDTWLDKDTNNVMRIDATVDYNADVNVTIKSVDPATVEDLSKLSEENDNKYANALKGKASGPVVAVDDVSPVPHDVACKVSGVPDLSAVTVSQYGKNLIALNQFSGTVVQDGVTFKLESGKVYCSGTAQKNTHITLWSGEIKNCVDFYLTGCPSGGSLETFFLGCRVNIPGVTNEYPYDSGDGLKLEAKDNHYIRTINVQVKAGVNMDGKVFEPMLNAIGIGTAFEPYKEPVTFKPTSEGVVNGMKSISPAMTVLTDNPGVTIDAEYNRDINTVISKLETKLTSAILSMGGNI